MSLKSKIQLLVSAVADKVNLLKTQVDNKQNKLISSGSVIVDESGNIYANTNDTTQNFDFTGSQIFTVAQPEITWVNGVFAIEQNKEDATKLSLPQRLDDLQYNFIAPNKIEITDELEAGDKIIVNYQHFIIQP